MATHSSILAWRIPWTEEPGGATVHAGRVGHSCTRAGALHYCRKDTTVRQEKEGKVLSGPCVSLTGDWQALSWGNAW